MNRKITKLTVGVLASAALTGLLASSAVAEQPAVDGINNVKSKIAGTYAEGEGTEAGKHDCAGKNDCKGKGGCKSSDNGCKGKNSCKGKGGCASDM